MHSNEMCTAEYIYLLWERGLDQRACVVSYECYVWDCCDGNLQLLLSVAVATPNVVRNITIADCKLCTEWV